MRYSSTLGKGSQLKIENITRVSLSLFIFTENHTGDTQKRKLSIGQAERLSRTVKRKKRKKGVVKIKHGPEVCFIQKKKGKENL